MHDDLHFAPERVIALHASASTSRQWRPLRESLDFRFDLTAPDLGGYQPVSLPVRSGEPGLARRAAPLIDEIEQAGEPVHLVGHSFGGAVALKIALSRPDLVLSLTICEPACFGLVRESTSAADRACFRQFQSVGSRLTAAVASGAPSAGMAHFIDFWNGAGAWEALNPGQKAGFADRAAAVMRDFVDGAYERAPLSELHGFTVPTLVISGTRSPEIARRICQRLARTIPNAAHEVLTDAGHMVPITDPDRVNPRISAHLNAVSTRTQIRRAA